MFIPHIYHKSVEPWELQEASEGLELKVGHALVLSEGKLALANVADKPQFICMQDCAATAADQMIHVERVREETVYETDAVDGVVVGGKYQIDGGSAITATTGGSAEVVEVAGDKVRVRFV